LVHPLAEEEKGGSPHQGIVDIKESYSLQGERHITSLATLAQTLAQAQPRSSFMLAV